MGRLWRTIVVGLNDRNGGRAAGRLFLNDQAAGASLGPAGVTVENGIFESLLGGVF